MSSPRRWAIAAASGSTAASPPTRTTAGWPFTARPPLGRTVAELIPGARFDVMEDEAHQPFQEVPEEWNARVDAFWRQLEARA